MEVRGYCRFTDCGARRFLRFCMFVAMIIVTMGSLLIYYKTGRLVLMKYVFSAPGRTEICGNHTDHQHGCVLAGAVNLETVAEVELNGTDIICVASEGYAPVQIDIKDLSLREEEKNTTAALIRGVAANFAERGAKLCGLMPRCVPQCCPAAD